MLGLCLASAAVAAIVLNALFWQTGPHPAPIFANPVKPAASTEATSSVTATLPRPRPAQVDRAGADAQTTAAVSTTKPGPVAKPSNVPVPAASPRPDPIAELVESSNRLVAVQQVLAEFGYGQIKPTGILGPETKAAIEKFEREHKLPVTGQLSERLARELGAMKGGPL